MAIIIVKRNYITLDEKYFILYRLQIALVHITDQASFQCKKPSLY